MSRYKEKDEVKTVISVEVVECEYNGSRGEAYKCNFDGSPR